MPPGLGTLNVHLHMELVMEFRTGKETEGFGQWYRRMWTNWLVLTGTYLFGLIHIWVVIFTIVIVSSSYKLG